MYDFRVVELIGCVRLKLASAADALQRAEDALEVDDDVPAMTGYIKKQIAISVSCQHDAHEMIQQMHEELQQMMIDEQRSMRCSG